MSASCFFSAGVFELDHYFFDGLCNRLQKGGIEMNAINENMAALYAWHGFQEGEWQTSINVRDFIQKNYTL